MELPSAYSDGSVTIAAGATAVTGVGTMWLSAIRPGDILAVSGLSIRILDVISDTSLTLAFPWPGAAVNASPYDIRLTSEPARLQASTQLLLKRLSIGELLAPDAVGPLSERANYDKAGPNFIFFQTDAPRLVAYVRMTEQHGVWSDGHELSGVEGSAGWSPVYGIVASGERRVRQLVDYVGGTGIKPTANIGNYVGPNGYVTNIAQATDERGAAGAGNVSGPPTTTDGAIAAFSGTNGSVLQAASISIFALIAALGFATITKTPASFELEFAEGATPLGLTIARTGYASRINRFGRVEEVPENALRHHYDPLTGEYAGVLAEEARTNVCPWSMAFADSVWFKGAATATANAAVGPDGLMTAATVIPTTASGTHRFQISDMPGSANVSYAASIYLKAIGNYTRGYFDFEDVVPSGTNRMRATFDLVAKTITFVSAGATVGVQASIEELPDGWFRIGLIATQTGSAPVQRVVIYFFNEAGATSFAGDGTSGFAVWGLQVEASDYVSSFIKTTGSAVTRSQDVILVPVTSDWYNPLEGSFAIEGRYFRNKPGSSCYIFLIDNSVTSGNIMGFRQAVSIGLDLYVQANGSSQVDTTTLVTPEFNKPFRVAFGYQLNNFIAIKDAITTNIKTDSNALVPQGINRMRLGDLGFCGVIKSVTYFPRRLANDAYTYLSAVA